METCLARSARGGIVETFPALNQRSIEGYAASLDDIAKDTSVGHGNFLRESIVAAAGIRITSRRRMGWMPWPVPRSAGAARLPPRYFTPAFCRGTPPVLQFLSGLPVSSMCSIRARVCGVRQSATTASRSAA